MDTSWNTEDHYGERAYILHPYLKTERHSERSKQRSLDNKLEEARGLAEAIRLDVQGVEGVALASIRPSTYIGKGKIDELAITLKANNIQVVIVDTQLSPAQHRNLEKDLGCKVIDRTALILEIFGDRARTKEGKLQVELAAQQYQKSRLVRSWTHLERQRGGAGFMGGPGETQIETDRRGIDDRIAQIKRQLETVMRTRELHRKTRRDTPYPIIALVGYTNAGKSTLFNRLTGAEVLAKDLLFATLDPTMRHMELPSGRKVILSDTVGFISELPTELVAAFRATLEEVREATILLHVRDMAHEDTHAQKADVYDVIKSLGLEEKWSNHTIEVYNKIDLLEGTDRTDVWNEASANDNCAAISAHDGMGCDYLLKLLDKKLGQHAEVVTIALKPEDGKNLAWLYEHGHVISREDTETAINLEVRLDPKSLAQWEKRGE
ncbi:MAG: GTPase HflX [Rickettsiales bacterium]|jgi:GTP-binding protein HflX|nr:GTPase HflX [Rickettsiales bacterium]